MPIVAAEIKMYRSLNVSNTPGSNGGRMDASAEIVDGVNNNIFPDVSQSERTAGLTTFRKVFVQNMNSGNLPFVNARLFVDNYTPGDDAVVFHAGTQSNLQSALSGSEVLYGCGKLDADRTAGQTSCSVLIEDASMQFITTGSVVRISNQSVIGAAGTEDFVTVTGSPSLTGSVVTFNFTPALQNAYAAASTRVAKVLSLGTLQPTVNSIVATTVGNGDFTNPSGANLYGSNQGTVDDQWTLTFTGATSFNCSGVNTGAVAAGSTLSTYAPVNPATGAPYFTITTAGFTGTWASGDTMTFSTVPASYPIWAKRVVPAGAAALSGNTVVFGIDGETA